jgi:hypothetical protein
MSGEKPQPFPKLLRFPYYWLRHPMPLTKHAGLNRFVWDLRYPSPPVLFHTYTIAAAIGQNTPALPRGPLVLPGHYTVGLIVSGHRYDEPLIVKMDPRITTPPAGLKEQFDLGIDLSQGLVQDHAAYIQVRALQSRLKSVENQLASNRRAKAVQAALVDLGNKAAQIEHGSAGSGGGEGLTRLNGDLAALATTVDSADAAPTGQCRTVAAQKLGRLKALLASWSQIEHTDLPSLNQRLRNYKIEPLVPRAPAAESASP